MANKLNCWEFKKCGRQPGGPKAAELGICPATQAQASNGSNEGKNGGRICWALAGTMCGGKVQGTFAQKAANCMNCPFYAMVRQEQGVTFKIMA
jgi:hypothetical protein